MTGLLTYEASLARLDEMRRRDDRRRWLRGLAASSRDDAREPVAYCDGDRVGIPPEAMVARDRDDRASRGRRRHPEPITLTLHHEQR
jgi:hypothetical protein